MNSKFKSPVMNFRLNIEVLQCYHPAEGYSSVTDLETFLRIHHSIPA